MNINTLAYAPSLPGAAQGASSTAEFQFMNSVSTTTKAEFTVAANVLNKRKFRISASGRVTGGTTTNFTVVLHAGTALATDLFSSGAKAVNSVSGSWFLIADLLLDSTADIITGVGYGAIGPTAVAAAIAQAASQDPTGALTFSIAGTFSASNANNAAYLDEFSIELL